MMNTHNHEHDAQEPMFDILLLSRLMRWEEPKQKGKSKKEDDDDDFSLDDDLKSLDDDDDLFDDKDDLDDY